MSEFKYLHSVNFEQYLKLYEQIAASIQKEINNLESKPLTAESPSELAFYKQSLHTLVINTFLQVYALVEESLYVECKQHVLKKNASILRFEPALQALGFAIDNEYWQALLHVSKIRNCLLHGNGRLDNDQYGEDTRNTINYLNAAANQPLIEVIDLKVTSKLKLNAPFLYHYRSIIKNFVNAQKQTIKNSAVTCDCRTTSHTKATNLFKR